MSEITSAVVPSLLRDLIDYINQKRQDGDPDWPAPASTSGTPILSLPSLFASAQEVAWTSDSLSELSIEQQCEVISTACDFAVAALQSRRQHLLSALQYQHNRQQPIYQFPSEVLSIIFEFVGSRGPGPLKISHVSKLWRQVALNTPSLWSTIHHRNHSLVKLFLHRSKSVPLDLDFNPDRSRHHSAQNSYCPRTDDTMINFASTLRPHAHRVRSLQLGCSGLWPRLLGQRLDMPMPMLHSLSISCPDAHSQYSTARRELPSDVFAGCTTSLRKLMLHDLCIPLASPIYTGLTSISLAHASFIDSSPHDFTRRLADCPSLNSLYLDVVAFDTLAQSPVLHPAHLPHLERVWFQTLERSVISGILNSIKVPASLNLSLMSLDGATLHDILPPPADIMENLPNLCATKSLYIGCGREHSLPKIRGTFEFKFSDHAGGSRENLMRGVLSSLSRIPFPTLKSLTISDLTKDMFDPAVFSHVLEHLPVITSLKLKRCSAAAAEILALTPTLCPSLQSITLDTCGVSGATAVALARSRVILDTAKGKSQVCLRKLIIRDGVGINADAIRTLQELPIEVETHIGSDDVLADPDSDSDSDSGSSSDS